MFVHLEVMVPRHLDLVPKLLFGPLLVPVSGSEESKIRRPFHMMVLDVQAVDGADECRPIILTLHMLIRLRG